MKKMFAAVVLMSALSGCFNTVVKSAAPASANAPEANQFYFVNGLTGAEVNASECTKGIARFEHSFPWWHVFVFGITGSLVDIATTKYQCAE